MLYYAIVMSTNFNCYRNMIDRICEAISAKNTDADGMSIYPHQH